MKKPLFGSLNKHSAFCSLLIDVQNINTALLRSVFTILFTSSFFLIFSAELKAQIVIEEKIEITQFKPSAACEWGGCEYDNCDSTELVIIFDSPQISSGGTTTLTLWYESSGGLNQYFENGEILQTNINVEPAYGQWTRISGGVYRITIPDTVTADSVSIIVSYENYSVFCWAKMNDASVANPEFTDCIVCPIWTGSGLNRYYGSAELIIKPDSFVVTLDPPEVFPGDTVQVKIQKRNADGTLSDFPPEQTFEIAKLDGCMLGNILAEGDSGAYFYNVTQPIYFATADSLVGDTTGTVLLRVGVVENKKSSTEYITGLYESNACFTGNFNSTTHKDITFEVKEPLEIIYPTLLTIERITDAPEMPTVVCKARLKKYYPGTIKYEWKYIVRKFYARRTLKKNPVCERISRSEFQGISYSATSGVITEWTVPFIKDSGYFYFKSLQPDKNKYDPLNHIYGCNGDTNKWYDTNDEIFTGGEVLITLIAKSYQTGEILARLDTVKLGKILGVNPDTSDIYIYANSNKIKAIMWKEGRSNQYTGINIHSNYWWPYNEEGWPLYGPRNGYGLMQLDNSPAATERQLWNWKANVDGGKEKLQAAYNNVAKNHGAPNEHEYNWTNAFHEYNHGNGRIYYKWTGRKWELNPNRIDSYGYSVYKKYTQLGGGN